MNRMGRLSQPTRLTSTSRNAKCLFWRNDAPVTISLPRCQRWTVFFSIGCIVSVSKDWPHPRTPRLWYTRITSLLMYGMSSYVLGSYWLHIKFTGEGSIDGETISLAVSNGNNPSNWTELHGGKPLLLSNIGTKGVRDPSIIRSDDGSKYWIIATVR